MERRGRGARGSVATKGAGAGALAGSEPAPRQVRRGRSTARADGGAASQAAAAGSAWLAADSSKTGTGVWRDLDCHKFIQSHRLCAEVPFRSGVVLGESLSSN